MTATIVDQLRGEDQSAAENALPAYLAFVPEAATSADVDTNRAREILERADKSIDDLARDVADYRRRAALLQQIADADKKVGPAMEAARDQLAELRVERDRLIEPIDQNIKKYEAELLRLHTAMDKARTARKSLIDGAPNWLLAAIAEAQRDLHRLQDEAALKLAPTMREAFWHDGEWTLPTNIHGGATLEAQERFNDFMKRRAADDERRAALQPRIAALKERCRRLGKLAREVWPLPSDLDRIESEAVEHVADAEAEPSEAEQTE